MVDLRGLPAVDVLLQSQSARSLELQYGRNLLLEALRTTLEDIRSSAAELKTLPSPDEILAKTAKQLAIITNPTLVGVINATGVILHTNLGRAPLSKNALAAVLETSSAYCTLEYDLTKGARGSRSTHAEKLLTRLTGAQAAFVVNNNAAAVMLVLSALAKRKRVIISRGQLIEIGGGFRIPDVMSQSGAKLVEVGTTNRVHLHDYSAALAEPAAIVMRAHSSNFRIIGFTSEPALREIISEAHAHGAVFVDDLGSGALLDTSSYGLMHEPMVQESLEAGADLVCFSGDKLLGGPQAGIVVGRKDLIEKIKKHPLARAVRADKLCLAALSATILSYLKGRAELEIPIWKMINQTQAELREKAQRWAAALGAGEVITGLSTVGGGSLPEETLPTFLLALTVKQPNRFLKLLRELNPPLIGRIENEMVVFDPRTVLEEQEQTFIEHLKFALKTTNSRNR